MLNVSIVMGRLVADPELRHTPNNIAVTSFTLAVDRSYVKSGENRQTDFIDIVAWRNTADFVAKYFKKGQMMIVEGTLQTRTYEDKNGSKRKAVEIVANNVNFGEAKRSDSQATGGYAPHMQASAVSEPAAAYSNGSADDFEELPLDDDLPF